MKICSSTLIMPQSNKVKYKGIDKGEKSRTSKYETRFKFDAI